MKEYIAIFEYNGEIQNLEFVSNSNSQEKLNSEARMYVNELSSNKIWNCYISFYKSYS